MWSVRTMCLVVIFMLQTNKNIPTPRRLGLYVFLIFKPATRSLALPTVCCGLGLLAPPVHLPPVLGLGLLVSCAPLTCAWMWLFPTWVSFSETSSFSHHVWAWQLFSRLGGNVPLVRPVSHPEPVQSGHQLCLCRLSSLELGGWAGSVSSSGTAPVHISALLLLPHL